MNYRVLVILAVYRGSDIGIATEKSSALNATLLGV
jgi:hypothetical protein